MARYRCLSTGARVEIDVVPTAVAVKLASGPFQLSDEVSSIHAETSISLVCMSGDGGGPSSSTIIR